MAAADRDSQGAGLPSEQWQLPTQHYSRNELIPLDKPEYNKRNKSSIAFQQDGGLPLLSLNRLEFRNFGRWVSLLSPPSD